MVQFPQMAPGLAGNPALKLQLDAQVGFLGALSMRTVDTLQRVNQLNLQLARDLVGDTLAACHEVLECQDPSQVAAVAMRRLQPSGEHLVHYQHGLFGVMADAQANLPSPLPAQRGRGASPG